MSRDRGIAGAVTAVVVCAVVAGAMYLPTVVLLGVVTVVAAAGLVRLVPRARRHQQLDEALRRSSTPAVLAETAVRLTPVDGSAFVSGLWRPAIYCSRDLPSRLAPDELRAVLLHEHAHQQYRDPIRLLLLEMVAPAARLHHRGRAWLERARAAREIEADRHALERGATRRALAAALFKVGPVPDPQLAGFASAVELRLQALLAAEHPVRAGSRRWPWILSGVVAAGLACLSTWSIVEVLCCR